MSNEKEKGANMTEKEIQLLKSISGYLDMSGDIKCVNAVYMTPASAMRNAADAIEKKDRVIGEFRSWIKILEDSNANQTSSIL